MKANAHQELSLVTHKWLTLAGNKINAAYCSDELHAHADYPAMTAVADFLDEGNMAYQAVQADASYIHEFNYPLLAHIKKPGNEYLHIIPDAAAWDAQKAITTHWSGIVIFPEKGARWQSAGNDSALKKQRSRQLLFGVWYGIGLALFAASVWLTPSLWFNLFGFLSLCGIFVSVAALGTELGIQSNTVKQVCGAVSKGGCEQVLKSRLAKGIMGITPADASLIYFAAQFTTCLLAARYAAAFSLLPWLAIGGIGIVVVSLYTQYSVIRQWCALCLGIAGVLTLQAIIALFIAGSPSLTGTVIFGSFFFFFTAVLIPVKSLIRAVTAATPRLAELKRWKSDAGLFLAQLQQEQAIDTSIWENDLISGPANAPVLITIACNPYCAPCARTHQQIDDIMLRYPGKLKVQIRLLCDTENKNDPRTKAVKAILQQAAVSKSGRDIQEMLADWFHWMDLNKWQQKWRGDANAPVAGLLRQHEAWMNESGITYTPTFFVNGRRLPGRYNLDELEKLIPQLAGEANTV